MSFPLLSARVVADPHATARASTRRTRRRCFRLGSCEGFPGYLVTSVIEVKSWIPVALVIRPCVRALASGVSVSRGTPKSTPASQSLVSPQMVPDGSDGGRRPSKHFRCSDFQKDLAQSADAGQPSSQRTERRAAEGNQMEGRRQCRGVSPVQSYFGVAQRAAMAASICKWGSASGSTSHARECQRTSSEAALSAFHCSGLSEIPFLPGNPFLPSFSYVFNGLG